MGSLWDLENCRTKGDLLATLLSAEASALGGSPLHVKWLLDFSEVRTTFPALNWVMSSGDSLSSGLISKFHHIFQNSSLIVAYGMTELSGHTCMINSGESLSKTGSVGRPIEGLDITIVSDDNEVCATGEMGRVFLQGPMLFEGYKGLPLKNRGFR